MPDSAKRTALFLLALLLVSLGCLKASPAEDTPMVRVAAAADLQPILPVLLKSYRAKTGRTVEAAYASSATLALQIANGAPFDLFLSADLSFPETLIKDGFADGPQPVPYARGTLVLWARKDSKLGAPSLTLLDAPSLQSLAIANPEHAPYGRAAVAALRSLGAYDRVQAKLRVAENIAQAAQFVQSGNADLGLISLTSALTPRLMEEGRYVEVPPAAYPPIVQGAALITASKNKAAARGFLEYLQSPEITKELAERGLKPAR